MAKCADILHIKSHDAAPSGGRNNRWLTLGGQYGVGGEGEEGAVRAWDGYGDAPGMYMILAAVGPSRVHSPMIMPAIAPAEDEPRGRWPASIKGVMAFAVRS